MRTCLILLLIAVLPAGALASDDASDAPLAVIANKTATVITLTKATSSTFNANAETEWVEQLAITCTWKCGPDVTVQAGAAKLTATVQPGKNGDTLVYDLPEPTAGTKIALSIKAGTAELATTLVPKGSTGDGGDSHDKKSVDLQSLIGRSCPKPDIRGDAYSASGNLARVVATPRGMLLTQMPPNIDENDTIEVDVWGDPAVVDNLVLRRTSDGRQLQFRIAGSDAGFNPNDFAKHGKATTEPPQSPCKLHPFFLDGFAPGRGQITITLYEGKTGTDLGTIDFLVDPLYSGIFSFGAIWTGAQKHAFTVLPGSNIISDTEDGNHRLDYILFFTPYVWGKRDIEKGTEHWYEHINPTVAVALSDLTDNGIAGLSVDLLDGIIFTAGVHVRRVTELDPNSKLKTGGTFMGTTGDLPLAHTWETGSFVGVSVDLRAAVQLTRLVLGTATSSGK